jgi:hypothetical protein
MKRRMVIVVDNDERIRHAIPPFSPNDDAWVGVTVESDEPIPEPGRVQEFRVRVVTRATDELFTAKQVEWLIRSHCPEDVTVTEVQS